MSFEYIRILNYIHIRKFEFIKLIDLKNAGWCGTPPISDKNYEGTWESIDGKLIKINTEYWSGYETFFIEFIYSNGFNFLPDSCNFLSISFVISYCKHWKFYD
jgi:hypothetical protein